MKRLYEVAIATVMAGVLAGPATAGGFDKALRHHRVQERAAQQVQGANLPELNARMGREMQRIYRTEDPAERAALMAAHRETMREAMRVLDERGVPDLGAAMRAHAGDADASAPGRRLHTHKRVEPIWNRAYAASAAERSLIRQEMAGILAMDLQTFVSGAE